MKTEEIETLRNEIDKLSLTELSSALLDAELAILKTEEKLGQCVDIANYIKNKLEIEREENLGDIEKVNGLF